VVGNEEQAISIFGHRRRYCSVLTVDDVLTSRAGDGRHPETRRWEALDAPFAGERPAMIKKRAGWLSALFLGRC
jgi:hypothetical protein